MPAQIPSFVRGGHAGLGLTPPTGDSSARARDPGIKEGLARASARLELLGRVALALRLFASGSSARLRLAHRSTVAGSEALDSYPDGPGVLHPDIVSVTLPRLDAVSCFRLGVLCGDDEGVGPWFGERERKSS